MVIYNLVCRKKHSFEGWFPSFEDYQKQADKKLISCPSCGTTKVEKVPHACAVHVKKEQATPPAKKPVQAPAAQPTAAEFKEMLIRCTITSSRTSKMSAHDSPKKRAKFTKATPPSGRFTARQRLKKPKISPRTACPSSPYRNPSWIVKPLILELLKRQRRHRAALFIFTACIRRASTK